MGTAVYHGNVQKEKIAEGMKLHEVLAVRDIIFQHLHYKYKMDPKKSFDISEDVRKGKGIKKWKNDLEQANIPEWMVTCMSQIKYLFPKSKRNVYK